MSKYQITKRLPPSEVYQFDTVQELESLDFVRDAMSVPNFNRLSLFKTVLMIEYIGANALPLAYIKNLEGLPTDLSELPLPAWTPPPPSV